VGQRRALRRTLGPPPAGRREALPHKYDFARERISETAYLAALDGRGQGNPGLRQTRIRLDRLTQLGFCPSLVV